jgi:hypothetical protein
MVTTNIATLKDNVETIKKVTDASFFIALRMFEDIYKDKETTEVKILTSIGSELVTIGGILYNKLKSQLSLLEEIIEEEKIKVLTAIEVEKEEKANVLP